MRIGCDSWFSGRHVDALAVGLLGALEPVELDVFRQCGLISAKPLLPFHEHRRCLHHHARDSRVRRTAHNISMPVSNEEKIR